MVPGEPEDLHRFHGQRHLDPIPFTTANDHPRDARSQTTPAIRDNVVNYVRGASHDNNAKLGDIFHSKPVVVGPPSRFFFDEGYSNAVGPTGTRSFADDKATPQTGRLRGDERRDAPRVPERDLQSLERGRTTPGRGRNCSGTSPTTSLGNLEDFLPADLTSHGYYVDSSPRVADVWIDPDRCAHGRNKAELRVAHRPDRGIPQGRERLLRAGRHRSSRRHRYTNFPGVLWEYTNPTNVGRDMVRAVHREGQGAGWIRLRPRRTGGWRSSAAGRRTRGR